MKTQNIQNLSTLVDNTDNHGGAAISTMSESQLADLSETMIDMESVDNDMAEYASLVREINIAEHAIVALNKVKGECSLKMESDGLTATEYGAITSTLELASAITGLPIPENGLPTTESFEVMDGKLEGCELTVATIAEYTAELDSAMLKGMKKLTGLLLRVWNRVVETSTKLDRKVGKALIALEKREAEGGRAIAGGKWVVKRSVVENLTTDGTTVTVKEILKGVKEISLIVKRAKKDSKAVPVVEKWIKAIGDTEAETLTDDLKSGLLVSKFSKDILKSSPLALKAKELGNTEISGIVTDTYESAPLLGHMKVHATISSSAEDKYCTSFEVYAQSDATPKDKAKYTVSLLDNLDDIRLALTGIKTITEAILNSKVDMVPRDRAYKALTKQAVTTIDDATYNSNAGDADPDPELMTANAKHGDVLADGVRRVLENVLNPDADLERHAIQVAGAVYNLVVKSLDATA